MMDIPPPLDGEFSSEEFPGTGVSVSRTRRAVARRAARSFRTSALSARIARAGALAPPHHVPVMSRAPSHATSGGA